MTEYNTHGVRDAISMLRQPHWTMALVMEHADFVDPELYIINVTLQYHITDNSRLEQLNGITTKLMQDKRKDADRVCSYQLTRPIR